MDPLMLLLRIVHIGFGVFWAGTIFFFVLLLEPTLRGAGAAAGPVMGGLIARGYLTIIPTAAVLTILSGIIMYWRLSSGSAVWMQSRVGMTLGVGFVAALIAFVIGMGVMRPAALRVVRLGKSLPDLTDEAVKQATMVQMDSLRVTARTAGRWVAVFLAVAVLTMAVARYT